MFPHERPRRLRRTAGIRALVRETHLEPRDLVLPLFFSETLDEARPISTMPGVSQHPVRAAAALALLCRELGLGGVILFGLPRAKERRRVERVRPRRPSPTRRSRHERTRRPISW